MATRKRRLTARSSATRKRKPAAGVSAKVAMGKAAAAAAPAADLARMRKELDEAYHQLDARTRELNESLDREAATSEILRVISGSPMDVQPVLDSIAESAARLCGAHDVVIRRVDADVLRIAAHFGPVRLNEEPFPVTRGTVVGRATLERRTIHIPDIGDERAQAQFPGNPFSSRPFRTILVAPLLREGMAIGTISMRRPEVRPFSDRQIGLLETFASQAVIAIENVRLFNETKEALEQQTATADILRVISSSPTDIKPVFDAILESATGLCGAHMGVLRIYDGKAFPRVAQRGVPADYARWIAEEGHKVALSLPDDSFGQMVAQGRPVHILDRRDSSSYRKRSPGAVAQVELGGARTHLAVPMLKEGRVVGGIVMIRPIVQAFTQKQIDLVSTFADQAVIAIENVRLFKELQARNAEVTEALEQQTVTADILKVISSSPTDTQPVFDAVAANATRVCGVDDANILRLEDGVLKRVAHVGTVPVLADTRVPVAPGSVNELVLTECRTVHIPDTLAPSFANQFPGSQFPAMGVRSLIATPLVRNGMAVGIILLRRGDLRPFTDKQIALLETFSDQAVIAMENVRLFKELQARNAEVTEALEQQTATAEVLKVISSSPTEVQPVFDVIVERAVRLCGARFGRVYRYDGSIIQMVASYGLSAPGLEQVQRVFPRPVADDTIVGRVILARRPYFIEDIEGDETVPPLSRRMIEALGTRSQVTIPMLRAGEPIGAITMGWDEPAAFDDQQVALLKTFADQAVIAIENVRLFKELQTRNAEVTEALEQQTVTADILKVISSSPTDTQPVFDAVAASAARVCGVDDVAILRLEHGVLRRVAHVGTVPVLADTRVPVPPGSVNELVLTECRTLHVPDTLEPSFAGRFPGSQFPAMGVRSLIATPLVRNGMAVGVIHLRRGDLRPFTDKQIALLETFADQAVIAMENVRLFKELQARNAEVTDALEQQTATAEVLKVISSSPTDTQPVFDAIVHSGVKLFDGSTVSLRLVRGDHAEIVASSLPKDVAAGARIPLRDVGYPSMRAIGRRAVVQVPDMLDAEAWVSDGAKQRGAQAGFRAIMVAPLLREDTAIGTISVTRATPGLFTDNQSELLKTFADQAVIAIENVRLFKELQARNTEVTEALEQQTATANILRVISSSPTSLDPVFSAILSNATTLCEANLAALWLYDGENLVHGAAHNASPEFVEFIKGNPQRPGLEGPARRAAFERRPVHVVDLLSDPTFQPRTLHLTEQARTVLAVPLLRESVLVGVIILWRRDVRAFAEKQIALLQTFADQAVIAIENVRLFRELQARNAEVTAALEQQTATAEVLKVISRSTFDLETVLQTLMDNAAILCQAKRGVMFRRDGDVYGLAATYNATPELREYLLSHPVAPNRETISGRSLMEKRPVHVHDVLADSEYQWGDAARLGNYRTVLSVPLLREGEPMGTIALTRDTVEPFSEQEIALVTTFADQATIAIENVRLFNEIQDKSRQLETANKHKSEFLANMSHELRTPLNAIIGFSEALGARMFGELNPKQDEYMSDIHSSGQHLLSLINDILDLSKVEAGRMELELSDFDLPAALGNALTLVRERAQNHGIALKLTVTPGLDTIHADERKVKQIVLNLLSNAVKFTPDGGRVELAAHRNGEAIEVSVADTGIGIAPEDQEAVFEEFRQVGRDYTRKQEGTGLGLALTRRFVELHGGRIGLQSEPGKGSTFMFTLPLSVETQPPMAADGRR